MTMTRNLMLLSLCLASACSGPSDSTSIRGAATVVQGALPGPTANPTDPADPGDQPVCALIEDPATTVISDDPTVCAAALFECEPGQTQFSDACGCGCIGAPTPPDRCARDAGDACTTDADCTAGGCGGELCYNPALSSGISTCDCVTPPSVGCGCVNGACAWAP